MAYPFGQMPTLDEFIQQVSAKYQVQRGTLSRVLTGPKGQTPVEYFIRTVNGRRVGAPISHVPPGQPLAPSQVRSLCRALHIPLDEFGLTLDDCSFRLLKWNKHQVHAALANSCSVKGAGFSREIRGQQSSIKRRRTWPTVFSRGYHDQWSGGKGTE